MEQNNPDGKETFASAQPFHEDAWEEEAIPLYGEINAVDTYFSNENELIRFSQELGAKNAETMDLSEKDSGEAAHGGEFHRENILGNMMEDARTEFAGELSPAQTLHPGFIRSGKEMRRNREEFPANPSVVLDGQEEEAPARNQTLGWIAIILAVASLFFWPVVLGPAAAAVGVVAYIRGSRALGVWSVVIGLLSMLAFLYLVPYYS